MVKTVLPPRLLAAAPLLAGLASALPPPVHVPDLLSRRGEDDGLLSTSAGPPQGWWGNEDRSPELDDVTSSTFEQVLDHFSKEDGVTFGQRYFTSDRYVSEGGTGEDAVNFLCVGGEGPSLDASVLVNSVHCTGDMVELAKLLHEEHGWDVRMYALEHRYYGESIPSPKKGEGGLRSPKEGGDGPDGGDKKGDADFAHLSSRQAVLDIVNFVTSTDPHNRWVAFGGSYPGMLSAWSHLLHPSKIYAAVSSSSPLQVTLDFGRYNDRVASDLADADVGGSGECLAVVEGGHAQVAAALEADGKKSDPGSDPKSKSPGKKGGEVGLDKVAEMFDVCGGADTLRVERNRQIFAGWGLLRIPAQGNDPSCDGKVCNIEKLCGEILHLKKTNGKDGKERSDMEVLSEVRRMQSDDEAGGWMERQCQNVGWDDFVSYYSTPTRWNANDRSWQYQTCNEFGFYQTCEVDSSCPYAKGYHGIDMDLELCQRLFGIDPDEVRRRVDGTLTYYGGRSLMPSVGPSDGAASPNLVEDGDGRRRLLFVTGDVDPWSELAMSTGDSDHPVISVEGASHHYWTHEVKDTDGPNIAGARRRIHETVSGWLGVTSREGNASIDGRASGLVSPEMA
ncbi:hypothetical protein THAOC_29548 [Thalassiosira oceanica]|uniref:Uncharacterized protein n=1 Tax=Thalassiosira oceanica TaxID=159749 RepID=K0RG71_THAOC|nr:hypothetical protein THAOC_29548 [Thalassiosira oceanica]|eukprot:EJK51289.1 hypothetical protein THAOC_29548 [Thalassiosira oceanica]